MLATKEASSMEMAILFIGYANPPLVNAATGKQVRSHRVDPRLGRTGSNALAQTTKSSILAPEECRTVPKPKRLG